MPDDDEAVVRLRQLLGRRKCEEILEDAIQSIDRVGARLRAERIAILTVLEPRERVLLIIAEALGEELAGVAAVISQLSEPSEYLQGQAPVEAAAESEEGAAAVLQMIREWRESNYS